MRTNIFLLLVLLYLQVAANSAFAASIELVFMQEPSTDFCADNDHYAKEYRESDTRECGEHTTCYECSTSDKCHWEINTCTRVSSALQNFPWWRKILNCPKLQTDPTCPRPFLFSIGFVDAVEFKIPNSRSGLSTSMPPNTFCYWEISNPKLLPIKIELANFSVLFPHN